MCDILKILIDVMINKTQNLKIHYWKSCYTWHNLYKKVLVKYEKQKNQLIKVYGRHQNTPYIKWLCSTMLLTANIKDCLRARLPRFTTTDSWMTDLHTLQEQSDLPTLNGLVWWLTLFTIWTFQLCTLQELIVYWHSMVWHIRTYKWQVCLHYKNNRWPTLNGLVWWLTLFLIWTFWLCTL